MKKLFIDTEFIEDGVTIDLVSIALVSEDGQSYYGQSCEFNPAKASDWVRDNVLSQLQLCPDSAMHWHGGLIGTGQCKAAGCPWRKRSQIREEIRAFVKLTCRDEPFELWGDYAAYDHVALAQLFGKMIDLPKNFPMYTHDIQQWADALENHTLPEQRSNEHFALADAWHVKTLWRYLDIYAKKLEAAS